MKPCFLIEIVLCGLFYFAPLSNAMMFVSCYEWQEKAYVSLDCGSEIIKINSVKHGLSQMPRESFCQSPVVDPVNNCFDTYNETEVAMFGGCNVMSSCNILIPFFSLQSKCNVGDGEGSKYVLVDYQCVPKTPPTIGMHQYDSSDTNHMSDSTLYLISMNYPSFIQDTNICELTVAENSILKVTVMELHQKKLHDLVCTFELIVSDTQTRYSECTRVIWEASDSPSDLEFVAQQSDLQLQIAMHKTQPQSAGEGKVWLQLKTYDTRNKDELKAGFKSLQCGSHISLWTTTPSESTTTTTSKPKTDTSRITIPSTQTTAKTASVVTTESATNSSTDTDSVSSIGVENVSPRNQAVESTAMPIIAGVVAGCLLLIIIVIIIAILIVQKYQKKSEKVLNEVKTEATAKASAVLSVSVEGSVYHDIDVTKMDCGPMTKAATNSITLKQNGPNPTGSVYQNTDITNMDNDSVTKLSTGANGNTVQQNHQNPASEEDTSGSTVREISNGTYKLSDSHGPGTGMKETLGAVSDNRVESAYENHAVVAEAIEYLTPV